MQKEDVTNILRGFQYACTHYEPPFERSSKLLFRVPFKADKEILTST